MLEPSVNRIVAGISTRNAGRIIGLSIDPPNALYASPVANPVNYPHVH